MPDVSWALLGRKPLLIGGAAASLSLPGPEGCYLVSFRFLGPKLPRLSPSLSNDAASLENTWLNGRRNNKPRNDDDDGAERVRLGGWKVS